MRLCRSDTAVALFASVGMPYPPFRASRQTAQQLPLWERKKKKQTKKSRAGPEAQGKSKPRSSSSSGAGGSGGGRLVEVRKKYFLQRLRPALDTVDPSKVLRKLNLTPFDKPFYFVKVSKKAGGGKQRLNLLQSSEAEAAGQESSTGLEKAQDVDDISILAFARQRGLPCTDSLEKIAAALEKDEIEREAEEMAAMEEA